MTSPKERLKVGFLAHADPRDARSWSGTYRSMLEALERRDLDVDVLPWEPAQPGRVRRWARLARPRGRAGHDWAVAGDHARAVREHLDRHPTDVVLAVAASTQSARLALRGTPLVGSSDTTFRALRALYEDFSALSRVAVRQGERLDRASVQAAAALIYPSRWAAAAAVHHCAADPDLITVAPYGANLGLTGPEPTRSAPAAVPVLLFVGANWRRKGGDTVVATAARLRAAGRPVRLVCVGGEPPAEAAAQVDAHVRIDKNVPAEMATLVDLFRSADVLLLPTQADTFGIVLSEAAALGVPAVASAVGAVPEIVQDGVTGRVLPPGAGVEQWADAVAQVLDPKVWPTMSSASRARFEQCLNWDRWAQTVEGVLRRVVAETSGGRAV